MSLLNTAKQVLEEGLIRPKSGANFTFNLHDTIALKDSDGNPVGIMQISQVEFVYDSVNGDIEPVFYVDVKPDGEKSSRQRYYGKALGQLIKKALTK